MPANASTKEFLTSVRHLSDAQFLLLDLDTEDAINWTKLSPQTRELLKEWIQKERQEH